RDSAGIGAFRVLFERLGMTSTIQLWPPVWMSICTLVASFLPGEFLIGIETMVGRETSRPAAAQRLIASITMVRIGCIIGLLAEAVFTGLLPAGVAENISPLLTIAGPNEDEEFTVS